MSSRRVEVDLKAAEGLAISRDGTFFAVLGDGGIFIFSDPDTIVFKISIDFNARRATFSQDDEFLLIIDAHGCLRKMDWNKKNFNKTIEERSIQRAAASSIGQYFAV